MQACDLHAEVSQKVDRHDTTISSGRLSRLERPPYSSRQSRSVLNTQCILADVAGTEALMTASYPGASHESVFVGFGGGFNAVNVVD